MKGKGETDRLGKRHRGKSEKASSCGKLRPLNIWIIPLREFCFGTAPHPPCCCNSRCIFGELKLRYYNSKSNNRFKEASESSYQFTTSSYWLKGTPGTTLPSSILHPPGKASLLAGEKKLRQKMSVFRVCRDREKCGGAVGIGCEKITKEDFQYNDC